MKVCKLSVLKSIALGIAAIAMLSSEALAATIVLSDDFSGPNGNLVGTTPDVSSGNWGQTGTTATNPIQITSNKVVLPNSGQDAYAGFTAPVSTATNYGILTSLDINVSAATATGDYFSHLSTPVATTTTFVQRLFARSSGAGYQLGILGTSGGTTDWGTTVLNFGQDYRVNVGWQFVPGALNDILRVSVGGVPYAQHTWNSGTAEPADVAAGNFRQGGNGLFPTLTVDNLSVAIVPEPASLTLFGLAGLACVGMVRRRG